ncbi:MAG: type III pantothenate kinase [Phycisphaerales bacterium]|nr:type III pantothenate kinase [Phycisphaerales bacterium]
MIMAGRRAGHGYDGDDHDRDDGEMDGPHPEAPSPAVVVDIGNSTTHIGLWRDGSISDQSGHPTASESLDSVGDAFVRHAESVADDVVVSVVIASVVPAALVRLSAWVADRMNVEPLVVGRQIPLPLPVKLPRPEAVGVDRLCAAAAAYAISREPCAVVDFGTAITIDVVDEHGSFIGGAILPGLGLQAAALHEHTALLPEVTVCRPDQPIGRDTIEAIRSGIYYGVSGAVRGVVETYASVLGRWPPVIATGADAELIAGACDFFSVVVPDLCLRGVGLAYAKWHDGAVRL